VTIHFIVAKGKKELRRVVARVDDGRLVEGADDDVPDISFTLTEAHAQALHDRSLDLSVGFMRGQVKMAGDFGALLHFLPLTAGPKPVIATPSLMPEPA
jgi:hypothetical protein